jgi:hypothetical protein
MLTEAMNAVSQPNAVVIICMSADGRFSIRTSSDGHFRDFDMYARAGALLDRQKAQLIE